MNRQRRYSGTTLVTSSCCMFVDRSPCQRIMYLRENEKERGRAGRERESFAAFAQRIEYKTKDKTVGVDLSVMDALCTRLPTHSSNA
ncbi:hypothetical protein KIN20_027479 [Parelaphostrongylus tenuis]|uniref:Uncharacterized protein n=1 Tax=Parelaphostrongylus tenuis TaxID=148309 RepID=A0AAD5WDT8_PARTN|nr:hypothetical protein KIN20_027479 [Parelaphostrongylus tenuis]